MRELENRLKDADYTRLAQILHWHLFGNQDITWRDDDLKWSQLLVIEAEIEAHWALQRQVYLQEKVKALKRHCRPCDWMTPEPLNLCFWHMKRSSRV